MVSKEEANKILKENKVRWVQGHFSDILGYLKSFTNPASEYINGDAWNSGIGFDGSSIKGFKPIHESDMIAIPDPDTLVVLPWGEKEQKVARVIVDIHEAFGGGCFEGDPRYITKRAMANAKSMGFDEAWFAPEIEFFVFNKVDMRTLEQNIWSVGCEEGPGSYRVIPESPEYYSPENYMIKPKGGYFVPPPIDQTDAYRNTMGHILTEMGIPIEYHHHEVATAGQVEFDFKPGKNPVATADMSYLYKYVSRIVGKQYGYLPTFMPKPLFADNASGMHIHQSLWTDGKPAFYDPDEKYEFDTGKKKYNIPLSQTARYYIGGILEHARGSCAICAPTVNSYRRLVPGFEAPTFVAWSFRNRSAMIRVPIYHNSPKAYRAEVRHPDPSGNFYLQFAVMLQCGLDGIKKKIDPGDPVNRDIYKLTPTQMREYNIGKLPTSLKEALDEMQSDEFVERALGKHAYEAFIDAKNKEWNNFSAYVSPWDFYQYFDI